LAWDEPGAGQSADVPGHFELGDYADCLAGLITGLGLEPVHLAGLSWGSTLSLALWNRHPHLVRTLILAGGYSGWKGSSPFSDTVSLLFFLF